MNDENLKPHQFKPGQSGNLAGKPKGTKSLTTLLREYLEQDITLKADPITGEKDKRVKVKDMLTLALIKKASQGSEKAHEMIWERMEGKVPQTTINVNDPNEQRPEIGELIETHRRAEELLKRLSEGDQVESGK